MSPVRIWGPGPYSVAVIHGGPGAAGEMATVARELSAVRGILEPLQTETTVEGQIRELRSVLSGQARAPVTLIGFSWGAFLSWMVAARYPDLVGKLILVGSAPFDDQYAASIRKTRLERLTAADRAEASALIAQLDSPETKNKSPLFARLGNLLSHADSFDPLPYQEAGFFPDYEVFQGIWEEAAELRRKKTLLMMARNITCPVVAIHGDYDPHPADGVNIPLAKELADFRFILLEKCGHRPWIERSASEAFYKLLVKEI